MLAPTVTDKDTTNTTNTAHLRDASRRQRVCYSRMRCVEKCQRSSVNPASIDSLRFVFALKTFSARPPTVVYTQGYTCRRTVWQTTLKRAALIGQYEVEATPSTRPDAFSLVERGGASRTGLCAHVAWCLVLSCSPNTLEHWRA